MKIWHILVMVCCVLYYANVGNAKRGFILISPRIIDTGGKIHFMLSVFEVPPDGEATIHLLRKNDTRILAESKVKVIPNQNMWVEMLVPPIAEVTEAKLHIFGNFSDGYKINETGNVHILRNFNITFIQTDKSSYQPKEIMKFRVLRMDSEFRILEKDTVDEIWIEDPNGVKVAEWKNLTFKENILQLELPLPEEPSFGVWSIISLINSMRTVQNFKVEEKVLPKFEVEIRSPYVKNRGEVISTEICARYSNGTSVEGQLRVTFTATEASEFYITKRVLYSEQVLYSEKISDCYLIDLNPENKSSRSFIFSERMETLEIYAEVVDNKTGVKVNKIIKIPAAVLNEPLKLTFLNAVDDADNFKPGIPYSGALLVQFHNGTAAESVRVKICAIDFQCHELLSDKNGVIRFVFKPVNDTILSFDVVAEVVDPNFKSYRYHQNTSTKLSLYAWYSPSGSYIEIKLITEELECLKRPRVRVLYTAKEGESFQFHHQVISRGHIVQQGSQNRTFYSKDKGTSMKNVGKFTFNLNLEEIISPTVQLLVFYIRQNGEVVADWKTFHLEKCWINLVKVSFHQKQQHVGSETIIHTSTRPSSVCNVDLVDKGFHLLGKERRFNPGLNAGFKKDKIFNWLDRNDINSYAESRLFKRQRCSNQPSDSDRSKVPISPDNFTIYYSKGRYGNSFDAFENVGSVVISDILETLPCVENTEQKNSKDSPADFVSENHDNTSIETDTPKLSLGIPIENDADEVSDTKFAELISKSEEIRSYFPENWLWEAYTTDSMGELVLERQLPRIGTEWIGEAVCINSKTGLHFSEKSTSTIVSQPFDFSTSTIVSQPFDFEFELPYSVIRDDVLPVDVSVFNFLPECLEIIVYLLPTSDYTLVNESSCNRICLCGQKSDVQHFMLRFIKSGRVNVEVVGLTSSGVGILCGSNVTAKRNTKYSMKKQILVKEKPSYNTSCPKDVCGCLLKGDKGVVTSPSFPDIYPSDINCVWEIVAPPNFHVYLNFTNFDLENPLDEDLCLYDSMNILSKTFVNGKRKDKASYCGSQLPPMMKSEENLIRIEFTSDNSMQKSGFSAVFFTDVNECAVGNGGCEQICTDTIGSYECSCNDGLSLLPDGHSCSNDNCMRNVTSDKGVITTPGYPNDYPVNKKCIWKFETSPGHKIKLVFEFFDSKNHLQCVYSYRRPYDGDSPMSLVSNKFCREYETTISPANTVFVTILSGNYLHSRNTPGILVRHSTVCGGILTADKNLGHIFSHASYGKQSYDNHSRCNWIIRAENCGQIRITFQNFDLEESPNCENDYVQILDGIKENSPNIGKFCGNEIPPEIQSTADAIFVSFRSDDTRSGKGFTLAYSEILNDSSRSISSGNLRCTYSKLLNFKVPKGC